MILAILKVMWLGLLRDRGALAMAFVLPPVIFVIFAAIFAGATGGEMRLRVAVVDQVQDVLSQQLINELQRDPDLRTSLHAPDAGEAALRREVQRGTADAAILIRLPLTEHSLEQSNILVLSDQGRAVAGPMVAGRLQGILAEQLPEVGLQRTLELVELLVDGYSAQQRARLDLLLEQDALPQPAPLVAQQALTGRAGADGVVSYYAGAVAMLFLLFAAMQSAASLIDERQSGVVDRLLIGPGGTRVVILGKGLFLVLQGVLQVGLIFLVAWLGYGVDWPGNFLPWLLTTVSAAIAAAGLALALCVSCRTRQQAQTLTTFAVLILSAVGGSMVPRFMMPPWLQELGWLTPNAWAIDAYEAVFWRGEPLLSLLPTWGVLCSVGAATTLLALIIAGRLART